MQSLCLKKPKVCSSAEVVADNEDLLGQILLRVPAQPLVRFKCVSKYWLSFISNPKFCDAHTLRNQNSKVSGFFFRSSTTSNPDIKFVSLWNKENSSGSKPLSFVPDSTKLEILQSCNGLLLCSITGRTIATRTNATRKYCVINPTTSKIKELPRVYANKKSKRSYIMGAALAFDPSKSPHYKVVCVISQSTYNQAVLYSSETRKWKIQESTRSSWPFNINYEHGVYCNGGIHWISYSDDQLSRYDVDEDSYGLVSSPSGDDLMPGRKFRYFGESRGHLQLIDIYKYCVTEFDVMEMGKDYSGWFFKYHVDLNPIGTMFPEMVSDHLHLTIYDCYTCCVLFLAREETEENSSILLHIPNKVILYNVSDKTVMILSDLIPKGTETMGSLQLGWGDAYHHIETLARV